MNVCFFIGTCYKPIFKNTYKSASKSNDARIQQFYHIHMGMCFYLAFRYHSYTCETVFRCETVAQT